jgi:hypothetical protein
MRGKQDRAGEILKTLISVNIQMKQQRGSEKLPLQWFQGYYEDQ